MRPLIGITSDFDVDPGRNPPRERLYLNAAYADAVLAAGGLPYPLPLPPEPDDVLLDELLAHLDGLLFTGGDDLDPRHYGQPPDARTHVMHPRRDGLELRLFRRADAARKPIFAICLGFQVTHVARGGQLIQHVDDEPRTPMLAHRAPPGSAFHEVHITPGSRLAAIVGATAIQANSRHHQAVDPAHPGRGLQSVGLSADGLLEASEDMDGRFLLAVQWHPEDMIDRPEHLRLFEALTAAARAASR